MRFCLLNIELKFIYLTLKILYVITYQLLYLLLFTTVIEYVTDLKEKAVVRVNYIKIYSTLDVYFLFLLSLKTCPSPHKYFQH